MNTKTLFARLFAAPASEANPVLVKAAKAISSVKDQLAVCNSDLGQTQADIREELKRQEEIRQASVTFKSSVKDLKKARANLEIARTKAETAADRTAALAEELENELFNWEAAADDYTPVETPEELATTPAETVVVAGTEPTPAAAPTVVDEWDGQDLSQLTPEQLELLQL